jgi:hypothetical protein
MSCLSSRPWATRSGSRGRVVATKYQPVSARAGALTPRSATRAPCRASKHADDLPAHFEGEDGVGAQLHPEGVGHQSVCLDRTSPSLSSGKTAIPSDGNGRLIPARPAGSQQDGRRGGRVFAALYAPRPSQSWEVGQEAPSAGRAPFPRRRLAPAARGFPMRPFRHPRGGSVLKGPPVTTIDARTRVAESEGATGIAPLLPRG